MDAINAMRIASASLSVLIIAFTILVCLGLLAWAIRQLRNIRNGR